MSTDIAAAVMVLAVPSVSDFTRTRLVVVAHVIANVHATVIFCQKLIAWLFAHHGLFANSRVQLNVPLNEVITTLFQFVIYLKLLYVTAPLIGALLVGHDIIEDVPDENVSHVIVKRFH